MMKAMESLCKDNIKVVILGATGLIGKALTKQLLECDRISQVLTIGRRAPELTHPKLKNIILDMERIDEKGEVLEGAHAVFCCLGTTMRQAGSKQSFRKVDFDIPLLAAKAAKVRGVKHFLVVSAQGASTKSSFFYSRVKGEMEDVLRQIPFHRLTIARPGLLLGRKAGDRPMEDMAGWLMRGLKPLWRGPLEKYSAVDAKSVAQALALSFFGESVDVQGLELIELNAN